LHPFFCPGSLVASGLPVHNDHEVGAEIGRRTVSIVRGLIVHADDFGETEEITRGISAGIEAGVITSTTIMANMPGTRFALGEVKRLGDEVSFGLHLNLCEGKPLTNCRSLIRDDGTFRPKRELALHALTRRLSLRELERELEAQAGVLVDGGVRLSHIDGHKHLHQLPVVCEAVVRTAQRLGLERVRRSVAGGLGRLARPSTAVRDLLGWRAGHLFSSHRLRYPSRIVDLADMQRATSPDRAVAMLGAGRIVEVFCHPGSERADAEKPGSCDRANELRFLLSDRWAEIRHASARTSASYWQV
jgi:predicted glycoside hydrolase/deacetylase ChbG (UPF0249 family)